MILQRGVRVNNETQTRAAGFTDPGSRSEEFSARQSVGQNSTARHDLDRGLLDDPVHKHLAVHYRLNHPLHGHLDHMLPHNLHRHLHQLLPDYLHGNLHHLLHRDLVAAARPKSAVHLTVAGKVTTAWQAHERDRTTRRALLASFRTSLGGGGGAGAARSRSGSTISRSTGTWMVWNTCGEPSAPSDLNGTHCVHVTRAQEKWYCPYSKSRGRPAELSVASVGRGRGQGRGRVSAGTAFFLF